MKYPKIVEVLVGMLYMTGNLLLIFYHFLIFSASNTLLSFALWAHSFITHYAKISPIWVQQVKINWLGKWKTWKIEEQNPWLRLVALHLGAVFTCTLSRDCLFIQRQFTSTIILFHNILFHIYIYIYIYIYILFVLLLFNMFFYYIIQYRMLNHPKGKWDI